MAGSQGNFELNVFKPVIIYNLLESIRLLSDACNTFCDFCIDDIEYQEGNLGTKGIEPDVEKMSEYVSKSLMLITALKWKLGYDNASKIAKKAHQEGLTLKQSAIDLEFLTEADFEKVLDPKKMTGVINRSD